MSEEAERLYERARALDPEARAAFVEEACRGDPRLRDELASLLGQAEAAEAFFDLLSDAVFSTPLATDLPALFSPDEARIGTTIGHYRILACIGSGGMGTVYRAHDTLLDRDVALKFLPPLNTRLDAEERLFVEARAAAALEHPNVCSIHEIGQADDGRPFIAMALYEGETLKGRLAHGPLPLEEAVATAIQIARGLAAAHARGIVHRDVKPGNVMLGADGTVRLLDFGLATATDVTLAGSGSTAGPMAYMSPEQARGDPLDGRTDLWSLGIVLYEMLTGVRPFRGEDDRALLQAILQQDPEPVSQRRPEVPASLSRVAERLLRKDPGARYQNAAEVLADLEHSLPSGGGTSRPTRRRAGLLAGSTMVVLMVVAGALWLLGRGRESAPLLTAVAREPSIAVLPLDNRSPDPGDAALAAGITEELIAMLAATGDVRVIASPSAAAFKKPEMDVRTIAESLGVSNILQGGLQKIGSRLRVQVRLVDGRDGSTRWSQAYDREFNEVFSVQDEIARAVAGELGLRFDKDQQLRRHKTQNIAAYEHYIHGWDPVLLRSESGIWKAQEHFERAIAADSTYAAAYAGLAITYVRRARTASDPGMPTRELLAIADSVARKAVALDESLAEVHYAWGRVREAMLDLPTAEREVRRAVALDPARPVYRRSLVYLNQWTDRPEEQLAEARRVLEIDPMNPYARVILAGALICNRRYDEAMAELQRVAAIQPPLQGFAFGVGEVYAGKQMWPEAIAALRPQAEAGEPNFIGYLGYVLARAGRRGEANRVLADLLARWERTGAGAYQIAVVYAALGDIDRTFAWLDRSIDDLSIGPGVMSYVFEDLHRDPRFERLRGRLGLQKL